MTESRAREEICRVGRSLFERGYVHGTAGNISVRLDEPAGGYLITPTDACLGFLDPARLARLDANARQLAGDRGSKTIALHIEIYCGGKGVRQGDVLRHSHAQHALRRADAECAGAMS